MRDPKLIDKFAAALPVAARRLLNELLRIAEPHDVPLYLVGGPLRDLLLERPSLDIDIAVEGDAPALARQVSEATGGRAITHPAFLTATVRIAGHRLDLITARSETYARPGALPTVRPATIREDLLRRDFTVNALALRLNGPERGEVLDPAEGQRDLDARLIRVLHERSFQDDATRILRAFRYATRLTFDIDHETLAWLKRDLPYLDTISGARIHHEFARIATEPERGYVLLRLNDVRALPGIHDSLHFHQRNREIMDTLQSWHAPPASFWACLIWPKTESKASSVASRLALTSTQRDAVLALPEAQRLATKLSIGRVRRSRISALFEPLPVAAVWTVAAATDGIVREGLLDYLNKSRRERSHLTGDDLLALGVPAGPRIGDILRRLRNAKLDGEVVSRQDEECLVRGEMRSKKPKPRTDNG
jgi:tRNA nucleotidyltransferase (CCA-adding enzyme)